ncbi:MAG: hypothetical protein ACLFQX_05095 [Candidatus Kapaibacterium sp.]
MQKYSHEEIFQRIEFVRSKAKEIEQIIREKDKLSFEEIQKISNLYKSRKDSIDIITRWIESDAGKDFIAGHPEEWQSKIGPVLKNEKELLDKIQNIMNNLGDQIRQLNKQKNVLVYTKGYQK